MQNKHGNLEDKIYIYLNCRVPSIIILQKMPKKIIINVMYPGIQLPSERTLMKGHMDS